VSKNVAVFVDVANIFYAAKAAGVDIDYVTLLKSASAGRDLVRAYAYTGLDPENENQRQFHAFLARNGYKVVSKDIRKYGDGKVKANLDIELVVDLMRTSHNLDIAVVVSGDGDFAPAIRAVQQTGVRVEVISFRGNTSSDLIDVADVFTDITQIARVERSSRSGRRVAAEDDLSMTEVPEKETEGYSSRRRRARRGEEREEPRRGERRRETVAPPAAVPAAGGTVLVALPGEKLSRIAGPAPSAATEVEELAAAPAELEGVEGTEIGEVGAAGEEAGRRRRRRRGGRGRGRGRGPETAVVEEAASTGEELEGEEEIEAEAPRVPQHSTFGSVWDSQLGMPTAPVATSGALDEEELEEPEIPEYLLAERRQRGRGGRGGATGRRPGGGRGSAYQQAVERERYGRGAPGVSAGQPRRDQRPDRSGRPPFERQDRHRPAREPRVEERTGGDEPWSEVPPEVAELLRAELARRGGQVEPGRGVQAPRPAERAGAARPAGQAQPQRGGRGQGGGRPATEAGPAPEAAAPATSTPVAEAVQPEPTQAPARTRARRRTTSEPAAGAGESVAAPAGTPAATRRRPARRAETPAGAEVAADDSAAAVPVPAAGETASRPRTRRAAPKSTAASATDAGEDTGAPTRRRATRRTAAPGA
jgi:uncharacterized LabA/DUF88 family protein